MPIVFSLAFSIWPMLHVLISLKLCGFKLSSILLLFYVDLMTTSDYFLEANGDPNKE